MRERKVHPAVFVEIERDHTDGRRQIFFCEIDAGQRRKFPFARIQINRRAFAAASENEINRAIVVEIGGNQARTGRVDSQPGVGGNVREGAVAVVAPQNIVRLCFR